jgi:hypothetical protein
VLSFMSKFDLHEEDAQLKKKTKITSLRGEVGLNEPGHKGEKLLGRFEDISSRPNLMGPIERVPYPRPGPPARRRDLDGQRRPTECQAKSRRARGARNSSK